MIDFSQFDSLIAMTMYFNNEEVCKNAIIETRWGKGEQQDVVCPYCGKHHCKVSKSGRFHCTACNHNFSCKVGTIFGDSNLSLVKWFIAMYLISSHKKGISSFSWKVFGWWARRKLKGADVFHVRSGAGQGGAIVRAKKLGMKVVCDHSIAHPAFMDKHLRAEYEKNGALFDLGMDSPFWRQIVKDCEGSDVVMVNSFFVKDTLTDEVYTIMIQLISRFI